MTTDACGSGSPSPLSFTCRTTFKVRETDLRVQARMCIKRAHKEDEKARPQFKPMPCTCMANREPCSSNLHAVERRRANDNRTPLCDTTSLSSPMRRKRRRQRRHSTRCTRRGCRVNDEESFFSILVTGLSKRSQRWRRDIRMAKQRKPATGNCMAKDLCKVWNPSRKGAAGQRGDASKCRTNTGRKNPNERFEVRAVDEAPQSWNAGDDRAHA